MSNAKKFIDEFTDIHPLPSVIATVTRLIQDPDSTMKDFEDVIKMDPVLVRRLLKMVNSSYYGPAQSVDSISRAVAFLGMKNLHNLVITDALKRLFIRPGADAIFSKKKLWATVRRSRYAVKWSLNEFSGLMATMLFCAAFCTTSVY